VLEGGAGAVVPVERSARRPSQSQLRMARFRVVVNSGTFPITGSIPQGLRADWWFTCHPSALKAAPRADHVGARQFRGTYSNQVEAVGSWRWCSFPPGGSLAGAVHASCPRRPQPALLARSERRVQRSQARAWVALATGAECVSNALARELVDVPVDRDGLAVAEVRPNGGPPFSRCEYSFQSL
jgi:hypothetical protein